VAPGGDLTPGESDILARLRACAERSHAVACNKSRLGKGNFYYKWIIGNRLRLRATKREIVVAPRCTLLHAAAAAGVSGWGRHGFEGRITRHLRLSTVRDRAHKRARFGTNLEKKPKNRRKVSEIRPDCRKSFCAMLICSQK
jgi:hypothetical protein